MSYGVDYTPEIVWAGIKALMLLTLEFGVAVVAVICGAIIIREAVDRLFVAIARFLDKIGRRESAPAADAALTLAQAITRAGDTALPADTASKIAPMPTSGDIAKAVHEHANIAFYEALINAVENAIGAAGFTFGNDRSAEAPLPYSVLLKAADALSMARTEFMQPYTSPDALTKRVEWDREDGYSLKYVTTIIDAMRSSGRYVQLLAEADCRVAVDNYARNGLTESAVVANGTAQIHIRSK
ncbi:hypothetical protein [Burkholderia ambifaria]|uniref:hypothetical protein n=1 Tax=Burkholderia ambifaria TaxID=152480 RepID=UPI00158B0ABE|nr:hypothetical protein [Burkholderia ambifaria]